MKQSNDEVTEFIDMDTQDRLGGDNEQAYFPEKYDKKLPDEGCWIFVVDPPNGSVNIGFEVPLLSLWWAKHTTLKYSFAGRQPYQAVITTPGGQLHLWPHEYSICTDITSLLGFEGVEIISLGGDNPIDEDQLFYLMSRGISKEEATAMLFSQIKDGKYCYITLPEYAVEIFGGIGRSLRSHIHANPRREH